MKFLKALIPNSGSESRKAQVLIAGGLLLLFGDKLGFGPSEVESIKWLLVSYLVGQGVADLGKGKLEAEAGK